MTKKDLVLCSSTFSQQVPSCSSSPLPIYTPVEDLRQQKDEVAKPLRVSRGDICDTCRSLCANTTAVARWRCFRLSTTIIVVNIRFNTIRTQESLASRTSGDGSSGDDQRIFVRLSFRSHYSHLFATTPTRTK